MNLSLALNFNQLKSLISQCGLEEKAEIVRMLEKDTFPHRLERFMQRVRTAELSLEDITAEVESVREQRYRARR